MFLDAEAMVDEAVAIAEREIQPPREDAGRLKAKIAALDDQRNQYMPLLLDRDLELLVKKAIGQRIAKAQAEQDQLRAAMDHVAERTGESAIELADACREAFREARQAFADVATDSDFNRLVEAAVGRWCSWPTARWRKNKRPPFRTVAWLGQ